MRKRIIHTLLIVLFLFVDFAVLAQPGSDDGTGGLEGNDPPPAPINGQIIWLGVIAIAFALYSINKYRKLA